jgi:hypothetical protein
MCKDCACAKTRKWLNAKNSELGEEGKRQRERNSKFKKYNITEEIYTEMFSSQGGVCAVCGDKSKSDWNLCIDHDHSCCPGERSCGKCVRGLLCHRCNTALGLLRDSPSYIESLLDYARHGRVV